MVYKLRHKPTGMYLSKGNYTRLVEKGGKIWNRRPSPKWFPKFMYLRGHILPEDWEIVEFDLVEKTQ